MDISSIGAVIVTYTCRNNYYYYYYFLNHSCPVPFRTSRIPSTCRRWATPKTTLSFSARPSSPSRASVWYVPTSCSLHHHHLYYYFSYCNEFVLCNLGSWLHLLCAFCRFSPWRTRCSDRRASSTCSTWGWASSPSSTSAWAPSDTCASGPPSAAASPSTCPTAGETLADDPPPRQL